MNVKKPETAGASKIQRPARKTTTSASSPRADAPGRMTPSELSRWTEKARNLPEIRTDLVERVKVEIAAGTYETSERIKIAAERMLGDIF